jgi:hypothetical protein
MTPLGVKTCGEIEFDIFEAKKRFSDSGKTCVLKRKVAKMRFFASIHRSSLNQKSVFSPRTCQIRFSRISLPLERSFPEKFFFHFFTYCVVGPQCLKSDTPLNFCFKNQIPLPS